MHSHPVLIKLTVGHAVGAAGIFASWDKNKDKEITKEEVYRLILRFFLKILKTVTEFLFLADQGLVFLDPSFLHLDSILSILLKFSERLSTL